MYVLGHGLIWLLIFLIIPTNCDVVHKAEQCKAQNGQDCDDLQNEINRLNKMIMDLQNEINFLKDEPFVSINDVKQKDDVVFKDETSQHCAKCKYLQNMDTDPDLNGLQVRKSGDISISKSLKMFEIPVEIVKEYKTVKTKVSINNITPIDRDIFIECYDLLEQHIKLLSDYQILSEYLMEPKSESYLYSLIASLEPYQDLIVPDLFWILEHSTYKIGPTQKSFALSKLMDGIGDYRSVYLLKSDEKLERIKNGGGLIGQIAMDILHEMNFMDHDFVRKLGKIAFQAAEKNNPGSGEYVLIGIVEDLPRGKRRFVERLFDGNGNFQG